MAATHTESFDTGDSSTLGPDLTWVEQSGDAQIVSNTCRAVGSAGTTIATATETAGIVNGEVSATISTNDNDSPGVIARFVDTNNFIRAYIDQTANLRIQKVVAGVSTQIGFGSAAAVLPDVLRLVFAGDAVEAYLDGIHIATGDLGGDLSAGGLCGVYFGSPQASPVSRIDSFEVIDRAQTESGTITDEPVRASDDDSIESYGSTDWLPTLNTEDVSTNSVGTAASIRNGIMRFALAIPQGATIDSCTIKLESASVNSYNNPGWTWKAQLLDDADVPAQSFWDTGTIAQTVAGVADSNAGTTVGTDFTSADLSTILQEIVNRENWVPGQRVAFMIISPNEAAASSQSWNFYSWDDVTNEPPRISVSWTVAAAGGGGTKLLTPRRELLVPQRVGMKSANLGDGRVQ